MKKIIALAVAGAFVVPTAYAADISVGGTTEFVYTNSDGATASGSNDLGLFVSATEEIEGLTVTGNLSILSDTDDTGTGFQDDGSNITVKGDFGTIAVGDNSGALDKVGDVTDIAPYYGGYGLDGDDAHVLVSLPAVNGFQLHVSHSADSSIGGPGRSVSSDANGVSATYSMGPMQVHYGQDEIAGKQANSYGVKYSANGIYVAYETGTEDGGTSTSSKSKSGGIYPTIADAELSYTGIAVSYKMGNIVVGVENQTIEEDGNNTDHRDDTVMFVEYNLGSNIDIYVSSLSRDGSATVTGGTQTASVDATAVGIEYNF